MVTDYQVRYVMRTSPALILIALWLAGCAAARSDTSDSAAGGGHAVEVTTSADVETGALLLALARRQAPLQQPLREQALDYFAAFADHPAVEATAAFYATLGITGPLEIALRAKPSEGEAPPPAWPESLVRQVGDGDVEVGNRQLDEFARLMAAFYRDAGVADFLEKHRQRYALAEQEVRALVPGSDVIPAMEQYYGERPASYAVVPSLLWSGYSNGGFLLDAPTAEGGALVYVVAPYVAVSDSVFAAGQKAGFFDPDAEADDPGLFQRALSELVVHEFGHSFVTPYLMAPAVTAELGRYEHLLVPIQGRMASQAYHSWWSVANEHAVRLGEIRIALAMGDTTRAERLRKKHISSRAFVYLPILERSAVAYEEERDRYPKFGAYVPELIRAFQQADTSAAYAALGLGPPRRVTFRVTAPAVASGDTVYVAGGVQALGGWAPDGLALRYDGEAWVRTVRLREGMPVEYKFTRGTWETEATDVAGDVLPNATLVVRRDTTVLLHVERWKDGQ